MQKTLSLKDKKVLKCAAQTACLLDNEHDVYTLTEYLTEQAPHLASDIKDIINTQYNLNKET